MKARGISAIFLAGWLVAVSDAAAQLPVPECLTLHQTIASRTKPIIGFAKVIHPQNAALLSARLWAVRRAQDDVPEAVRAGYPSPSVALLHAEKLALSAEQKVELKAWEESLHSGVRKFEQQKCKAEIDIRASFETVPVDAAKLKSSLIAAEAAGASLREFQLEMHLKSGEILTQQQRRVAANLRSFSYDYRGLVIKDGTIVQGPNGRK